MAAPFRLFSSLPSEVRHQIWRDTLPGDDTPALYPYRTGCWCPRWLLPSEETYDPRHDNIDLEFRHDLLDDIQVDMPLVFVNSEARSIALRWASKQGIEMRFSADRQCHIFVRGFHLDRDALYVSPHQFDDFCVEPYDRMAEPDLLEKMVSHVPDVTRFAVPEALFHPPDDVLYDMVNTFGSLEVLYIIVNTPPPDFPESEGRVQRQWELEGTQGRAFFWSANRGEFDLGESGEYIGDGKLYRQIQELSRVLVTILVNSCIRRFEIRPVFAVER